MGTLPSLTGVLVPAGPLDGSNLVDLLIQYGPGGLVVILFVLGWITPKPGTERMAAETERWRQLYETERAAHETTRKAHAEETRAALLAGAEGSQMAVALLTELKARKSEAAR